MYVGTVVDQPADPVLYRRVVEAFPDAWIEDPKLTPETEAILAGEHDRITWDAIIHTVDDVKALPFPPKMINVKPSRAGGLRPLFALNQYCEEHGIQRYGGGQFELGVGRGQIQYLASIFHPDTPNDVAPGGYNDVEPGGRPALEPAPGRGASDGLPLGVDAAPGLSLELRRRVTALTRAQLRGDQRVGCPICAAPALPCSPACCAPRQRRRRRTPSSRR